jgi:hypothetical protein
MSFRCSRRITKGHYGPFRSLGPLFGTLLLFATLANWLIMPQNMEAKRWGNTSYSESGREYNARHYTVRMGSPHNIGDRSMVAILGPTFVYPVNGQHLGYDGWFLFKVSPVDGASGYLYGFFQNGTMVWENYRDEHTLSGTEYGIAPGSAGHSAIQPGALQVWVRGLVNGQWTDATIINIDVS